MMEKIDSIFAAEWSINGYLAKRLKCIKKCICQGCRRSETSVFFSVKINISTMGGFRVGFLKPDTNHP